MSDPLAANITESSATGGARVPSLRAELRSLFAAALESAFPELASSDGSSSAPGGALCPAVSATTKKDAKFGDYQCNNAMGVFGRLKGKEGAPKAPRDVAAKIVAALPGSPLLDAASPPSLAGPGFINIRLSRERLGERLVSMLVQGPSTWAPALPAGVSRAVVDFSSPNVAKEMHRSGGGEEKEKIRRKKSRPFFTHHFFSSLPFFFPAFALLFRTGARSSAC